MLNRLRSGPEDWRLAYLTVAFFVIGALLFFNGPFLWPLEPLLILTSFLMARASLAVLAEHDEPAGARRWLIYPPLLLWYVPVAAALVLWPVAPIVNALDDAAVRGQLVSVLPTPFWVAAIALAVLTLGAWWAILGWLFARFDGTVRAAFSPFADWFDRRHARRLALAGLLMIVSGGIVLGGTAWR